MDTDDDKGMLYGAASIALFVVVFGLFKAKTHFAQPSTEQELVAHLRTSTPQPQVVPAPRDYADSDMDENIEQYLLDAMRDMEPGILQCLERWPNAPGSAKARLRTDNAGRLEALSIQGSPPAAEHCLGIVLQAADLPRRADAVIRLAFPGITGPGPGAAAVGDPNALRTPPGGDIYWGETD
jgi:hypothetical protein